MKNRRKLAYFPFLVSPVYGAARDLGPYELKQEDSVPSVVQQITAPESKGGIAVLQGNTASERIVRFSLPDDKRAAQLELYDLSGRIVRLIPLTGLSSGMDYYQPVELPDGGGIYIVRLSAEGFSLSAKLL